MIIGIDIDDTISDTYNEIFNYAQKYTIEDLGKSAKLYEIDQLLTHMYVEKMHNWSKQESDRFIDKYYEKIVKEVQPKKFAVETINKLKEEGNEIYLITARFDSEKFDIEEETKKWLEKNNIKYDKLFLNANTKSQLSKENNVDIFIDDSFKNCVEVANEGIKAYIFDTKVNMNLENEKVERVYSWLHLYQEIRNIKSN